MANAGRVSKMGRPTLDDEQQAEVFARMSIHEPKSAEYRKARQDLAVKMGRTERAIDLMYERLKTKFLQAAKKPNGGGKPKAKKVA